ncbi:MAG: class B sortase [Eubacteriales bacterium]|nr:class B sortase [Eubacteriales bacterium]
MQRSRRGRRRRFTSGKLHILGYRIDLRRFIPFLFFLTTAVVSIVLLIDYAVDSAARRRENETLAAEYAAAFAQNETELLIAQTPEPQTLPTPQPSPGPQLPASFRRLSGTPSQRITELYQQNNDLIGWLYIKGVVNLPVVYRDNVYYLDRNFSGKQDKGGTLFLDEYHPLTEQTQKLVIHGHNMHDSSMFGILSSYNKLPVVKNHPFAQFSTLYEAENYVVFAVLRVNPDQSSKDFFPYVGKPGFSDAEAFEEYISELRRRSLFDIPVDVEPADALLALSTCIEDDRLVVFYRKMRDGETQEQLQALVDQAVDR